MKTKKIALVLSILMLVPLFAACGSQQEPAQSSTAGTAQSTEEASQPPEKVTLELVRLDNPDTASENALVWEEIHKKFLADENIDLTVNITVSPWDTAHEVYVQKLAAGDRMDAALMHSGIINTIVTADKDALKPLDQWLPQYAPEYFKMIPEDGWQENRRAGKIIGLPNKRLTALYLLAARTDVLVDQWKLNVQPQTIEELETLFTQIKEKDPDSIPLTGAYWAIQRIVMPLVDMQENYAWGASVSVFENKDGKVTSLIFHENFPKLIELMSKWIKNGWIPKETVGMNNVDSDKIWHSGKAYIDANYYSIPLDTDLRVFKQTIPDARVEVLPIPRSVSGTAQLHGETAYNVQWVLPVTGEEAAQKAFLKYLNWQAKDPGNYSLAIYGIEGRYFKTEGNIMKPIYRDDSGNVVTDEEQIKQIIDKQAKENFLPYRSLYSVFSTVDPGYVKYSETTPKTIIEAEKYLSQIPATKVVMDGQMSFDLTVNDVGTKKANADNAITAPVAELLSGVRPASDLPAIQQLWLDNGGKEVVEEFTKQFEAWKASMK